MDYACIPQVACPIPLSEDLIPEEIRKGGGRFFESFRDVAKSYRALPLELSAAGDKQGAPGESSVSDKEEETKGEPRMNNARRATTDHRQSTKSEKGSSAKFWLREAVKVSQPREGGCGGVCYFMCVPWGENKCMKHVCSGEREKE